MYKKISNIQDFADLFILQDDYKQIYDYILDKLSNNQDINISSIYSCFDIEKDSVWDKVINYTFPSDDVFQNYLTESVLRLRIGILKNEKQIIKTKMTTCENIDEKFACYEQTVVTSVKDSLG